jgi:hypothetical protein
MKLLAPSHVHALISDPTKAAALTLPVKEALRYGFDTIAAEKNPFWHRSPIVIWWDDASPLALYHRKNDPILEDFALLFEKPEGIARSKVCNDDAFFESLL